MKICPKCNQQIDEGAKFCSACGTQLVEHVIDVAWVAGIQEEIKEHRTQRIMFTWVMVLGILILAVPLIGWLLFPAAFDATLLAWAIPLGLAGAIAGGVVSQHYDNKIKKLTKKLTEGKPEEK